MKSRIILRDEIIYVLHNEMISYRTLSQITKFNKELKKSQMINSKDKEELITILLKAGLHAGVELTQEICESYINGSMEQSTKKNINKLLNMSDYDHDIYNILNEANNTFNGSPGNELDLQHDLHRGLAIIIDDQEQKELKYEELPKILGKHFEPIKTAYSQTLPSSVLSIMTGFSAMHHLQIYSAEKTTFRIEIKDDTIKLIVKHEDFVVSEGASLLGVIEGTLEGMFILDHQKQQFVLAHLMCSELHLQDQSKDKDQSNLDKFIASFNALFSKKDVRCEGMGKWMLGETPTIFKKYAKEKMDKKPIASASAGRDIPSIRGSVVAFRPRSESTIVTTSDQSIRQSESLDEKPIEILGVVVDFKYFSQPGK